MHAVGPFGCRERYVGAAYVRGCMRAQRELVENTHERTRANKHTHEHSHTNTHTHAHTQTRTHAQTISTR